MECFNCGNDNIYFMGLCHFASQYRTVSISSETNSTMIVCAIDNFSLLKIKDAIKTNISENINNIIIISDIFSENIFIDCPRVCVVHPCIDMQNLSDVISGVCDTYVRKFKELSFNEKYRRLQSDIQHSWVTKENIIRYRQLCNYKYSVIRKTGLLSKLHLYRFLVCN